MALLIDGTFVEITFDIHGNEDLKRKCLEYIKAGRPFEIKTSFNGEGYWINPQMLASMHLPSRMITKHANMEQLEYQIGIAFIFCTDIIHMPKQLSLKQEHQKCITTYLIPPERILDIPTILLP